MATPYLSNKGRYKYTGIYNDVAGPVFGPWMVPDELDVAANNSGSTYIVAAADMGFLDRIAVRFYGAGNEMLWWALCRVNGIVDIETDVAPGTVIYVPSSDAIQRYLSAITR